MVIVMSLWNEFIQSEGATALATADSFPFITALRVRVQTFCSISLSAKELANIVDEPTFAAIPSLAHLEGCYIVPRQVTLLDNPQSFWLHLILQLLQTDDCCCQPRIYMPPLLQETTCPTKNRKSIFFSMFERGKQVVATVILSTIYIYNLIAFNDGPIYAPANMTPASPPKGLAAATCSTPISAIDHTCNKLNACASPASYQNDQRNCYSDVEKSFGSDDLA